MHSAPVQPGYTNHAGNVIAGWPTALTATQVTLGACATTNLALSALAESGEGRHDDAVVSSAGEGVLKARGGVEECGIGRIGSG